jgi:hypothetical protein
MTRTKLTSCAWLPALLALCACTVLEGPARPNASAALIPEYRGALDRQPDNVLAYFEAWLAGDKPVATEPGTSSWSYLGSGTAVARGADRLLAGYEAFCSRNRGQIVNDPHAGGLRCVGPKDEVLGQLSVDVLHPPQAGPTELRFTVETGERVREAQAAQASRYRQVLYALDGNGPSGDLLLANGEVLQVARFGRLSGPDVYAVQLPEHGLIAFTELLSVRWTEAAVRLVLRDGSVIEASGAQLTPSRTLVRLTPAADQQLLASAPTRDAPLRFVTLDPRGRQPRQVRLRNVDQVLKVTVSPRPPAYPGGPIEPKFGGKERDAFAKALTADARKASARLGRKPTRLDLDDTTLREEVEKLGRSGPCARAQSEAGLKTGDLALTEYLVCAQYRSESALVLKNGGQLSPDKTPLLYLSRAARAPWYDFDGVMR